MNYAVDQIIEDIVILENTETLEKIQLNIDELPGEVKEGNIFTLEDGKYILNNNEEEIRRQRIADKLERLKRLKNRE